MDNIRKLIIKQLKKRDAIQIQVDSDRICDKLLPYINKNMVIGCYMAMIEEVQLGNLIKQREACWAIPKMEGNGTMSFYQITKETTYKTNVYGIDEPIDAKKIEPMEFDVIIVPMVGFDEQKHRVGHGAGYYDRYLPKTKALKIGVAFELQKCDRIETYLHDIDMDIVITQAHIYE